MGASTSSSAGPAAPAASEPTRVALAPLGDWQKAPLPIGVDHLAVSGPTVYADGTTAAGQAELWISRDGGLTFARASSDCEGVIVAPASPSALAYVGDCAPEGDDTIAVTHDAGRTFSSVPGTDELELAAGDDSEDPTLYAIPDDEYTHLLVSTDGGATFTKRADSLDDYATLAWYPPATLIASYPEGEMDPSDTPPPQCSTDGGRTFRLLSKVNPDLGTGLVADWRSRIVVHDSCALAQTDDAGKSRRVLFHRPCDRPLGPVAADRASPSSFWFGDGDHLLATNDGGATYTTVAVPLEEYWVDALALSPAATLALAGGALWAHTRTLPPAASATTTVTAPAPASAPIAHASTALATWQAVPGLRASDVQAAGDTVVAWLSGQVPRGDDPDQRQYPPWISLDGGASFTAAPVCPGVDTVAIDPVDPRTLYVSGCVDAGFAWRTTDGGRSFTQLPDSEGIRISAVSSADHKTLFGWRGSAFEVSRDRGQTWSEHGLPGGASCADYDPCTVIVAGDPEVVWQGGSVSADLGRTWHDPPQPKVVLPPRSRAPRLHGGEGDGDGEDDGGGDWGGTMTVDPSLDPGPPQAVDPRPGHGNVQYAIGAPGCSLLRSDDSGKRWTVLYEGHAQLVPQGDVPPEPACDDGTALAALAVDSNGTVYIWRHGLEASTDGGHTFRVLAKDPIPTNLDGPLVATSTAVLYADTSLALMELRFGP
jgi:hypothetical protein